MTPLLITFSGPDGSGKTTQIELLKSQLESMGHKPVIFWTRLGYTPGFELAKKLARRALGKKVAQRGETSKRDQAMKKGGVQRVWRLVATADLVFTYAVVVRALQLSGHSVIGDRYVWDALVDREMYHDEAGWMDRAIRGGFRLLGAKPDQALLLNVPLEISQARSEAKDEPFPDPPEKRAQRHKLYQALQGEARLTTINVDRPVDEIAAEIEALIPNATR